MFLKEYEFDKIECYNPEKGFGFITEQSRKELDILAYPELNSGFVTPYWYQDEPLTLLERDENGCFLNSAQRMSELEKKNGEAIEGEYRYIPLCLKADVPESGNYKVTLTSQETEEMEEVFIFTGRRRLAYKGSIPAGTLFCREMIVNVCDIIPRGQTGVHKDRSVDITVVSKKPRIWKMKIESYTCPTVYIAGDSTVTDQSAEYPYAPGTSYCGWGQMISAYLDEHVAVSNHAHSGLTTETFCEEGHYQIVEKNIKPGDFLMIQFGHNDQKHERLQAERGYRDNLIRYIRETREKGAYPILITPVARNTWLSDGTYNDLLKEHSQTCLDIGQEMKVPVLELHRCSMEFIKITGLEAAKSYFYPGDYTHSNDYGGYVMAGFVAAEITRNCTNDSQYKILADSVTAGFGPWQIPKRIVLAKKPERFDHMQNPCPASELLAEVDELEKPADRASVLDMVTKTFRFVPVNVYNDMFEDVGGHEWYAGAIESAYQNGIIQEELIDGRHLYPEKIVSLEEMMIWMVKGYMTRKQIPKEQPCIYDERCRSCDRPFVRVACQLGLLPEDGSEDLNRLLTRKEAVELCRKMNRACL